MCCYTVGRVRWDRILWSIRLWCGDNNYGSTDTKNNKENCGDLSALNETSGCCWIASCRTGSACFVLACSFFRVFLTDFFANRAHNGCIWSVEARLWEKWFSVHACTRCWRLSSLSSIIPIYWVKFFIKKEPKYCNNNNEKEKSMLDPYFSSFFRSVSLTFTSLSYTCNLYHIKPNNYSRNECTHSWSDF